MDERHFQEIALISGPGAEESLALRRMAEEAEQYVTGFPWSHPVRRGWLADGAGGIIALYLFEFAKPVLGGGRRLWVIVGEFPRTCLPVVANDSPRAAMERYADLLDHWIDRVMSFQPPEAGEMPLELEPTMPEARRLRLKLDFIRQEIIPAMD